VAALAYYIPADEMTEAERERLIMEHLPQVRLIARKIHERVPSSVAFDDLLSAGVIGLIQAIDNFDAAQGVKLRTYAEFRIRGAILDSLREGDWAPRMKRKLARELEAAVTRAEQALGRAPEESDIAAQLGIPVEEYRDKLTIVKLNVDENPKTSQRFNVRSIPTLILFKNGQVEGQKVGAPRKSDLVAFLDSKL